MSDGPEKQITDQLDAVLQQSIDADKDFRQVERDLNAARRVVSDLDEKARRLRLALFSLQGEYDKNAGDANKANHERRMELGRTS